ncbi:MAG: DUF1565 domain-containing protein, partial [Desulfobacterales bacterium]|nr:DUF1565 domain-containing protein [Desulfobacterales bacterium]
KKILFTALFILLTAGAPCAETYYASPSGDDAASGSSTRPWRTLQHAADMVSAGDVLIIRSGEYAGFRAQSGGAAGAPITFRADAGASVALNASGAECRKGSVVEIEEYDWWVLEGLEVTGAPQNAGVDIRVADHVTVRNCYCHHNRKWGIFTAFADDFTAEYNECAYNEEEHGIYHSNSGDDAVIRYNTCHHNGGCGIQINADPSMGGDGISDGNLITHNTAFENGAFGGAAINLASVRDTLVANNLLYNNHAGGVAAWDDGQGEQWGSKNNRYYNNTIHMPADGRWAVNLGNGSSGSSVYNNILINENPGRGGLEIDASSLAGFSSDNNILSRVSVDETTISLSQWQNDYARDAGSADRTAAQTFVAPGSDYHLLDTAWARDNGAALPEITSDLENVPRPAGQGVDIGALEWDAPPIPDIKANGSDGPVTLSPGDPLSITVSVDPGLHAGQSADWWIGALAPSGWSTLTLSDGWLPGINLLAQSPLVELSPPIELLNTVLSPGSYLYCIAVDHNDDGLPDATWWDSVEVRIEGE